LRHKTLRIKAKTASAERRSLKLAAKNSESLDYHGTLLESSVSHTLFSGLSN